MQASTSSAPRIEAAAPNTHPCHPVHERVGLDLGFAAWECEEGKRGLQFFCRLSVRYFPLCRTNGVGHGGRRGRSVDASSAGGARARSPSATAAEAAIARVQGAPRPRRHRRRVGHSPRHQPRREGHPRALVAIPAPAAAAAVATAADVSQRPARKPSPVPSPPSSPSTPRPERDVGTCPSFAFAVAETASVTFATGGLLSVDHASLSQSV